MAQETVTIQDRWEQLITGARAIAGGFKPRKANTGKPIQLACWSVLLLLMAACAPATLGVSDIYGKPGPLGGVCAAYFTIDNPTDQADVLIGARSDIAELTAIHTVKTGADGKPAMVPQASVDIPARANVVFKPGALHIMFTNLKRDMKAGDSFPLTLQFQNRGEITIQVTVKDL